MVSKKRILVICFSNLSKDPRVIRQIQALEDEYELETIGLSAYSDRITNYSVSIQLPTFIHKLIRKGLSFLHAHKSLTNFLLNNQLNELTNMKNAYDVIICNDLDPLPLACHLSQEFNSKLIVDLHEYYPSQTQKKLLGKWEHDAYVRWLCKEYIPRADIRTSVCNCVSDKYQEELGLEIEEVITNATSYCADSKPSIVSETIRCVHHGISTPARELERMLEVIKQLPDHYELHFYLLANYPDQLNYLERLKSIVAKQKLNVEFHNPVQTQTLAIELNQYDIGLYILPPVTDNDLCALPNKFFEFIQARLALAVSPNPEMARLVNDNELGIVSEDYSAENMAKALGNLTAEEIATFKTNSHKNAYQLSSIKNIEKIKTIVSRLI